MPSHQEYPASPVEDDQDDEQMMSEEEECEEVEGEYAAGKIWCDG